MSREKLLRALEAVQPGLSTREIVEQSSCLIFKGGEIITYNDEVACRAQDPLGGLFEGAVKAEPVIELLRKMPEDEVEVSINEDRTEVLIKGKRRRSGVRMHGEIILPVESVEVPVDFHPLHADFCEAVSIAGKCAGRDESQFKMTLIHLHPKWIEACDNYQLCRWKMKTGFAKPVFVRQSSVKFVKDLGVTEFSETKNWIHFRNQEGFILSCRHYVEDYPDLRGLLQVEGEEVSLPKGIVEATKLAQIFSGENAENDQILVELQSGRLKVKGVGFSGWYSETKKVNYVGKSMTFLVSPTLLSDLVERHPQCVIGDDHLKADGGPYQYVTVLNHPEEKESKSDERKSEPEPGPVLDDQLPWEGDDGGAGVDKTGRAAPGRGKSGGRRPE